MIKHKAILLILFFVLSCDLNFYETTTAFFEDEVQLTHDGRDKEFPAWSPNGDKIAYTVNCREVLLMSYNYILDDTLKIGRFASLPGEYDLSPDRTRILYGSGNGLRIQSLKDGSTKVLTSGFQYSIREPKWSDDGEWIVFHTNYSIWIVSSSSGSPTEVRNSENRIYSPTWSPDNKMIVFTEYVNGMAQIFTTNIETEFTKQLTTDSTISNQYPDWSPDGLLIAYTSNQSDTTAIWTMAPDGSNKTKITNDIRYTSNSKWSPDGSKIACGGQSSLYGSSTIRIYSRDGIFLYSPTFNYNLYWYDNESILFAKSNSYAFIETFSLIDSFTTQITPKRDFAEDTYPTWFPSGERLAYVHINSASGYSIRTSTMCGQEQTILPVTSSIYHIDISPDGKWLLFEQYSGRLCIMPLPSGEVTDLIDYVGPYLYQPSWNPASNGAVCVVPPNRPYQYPAGLSIINVDSSLQVSEIHIPGEYSNPDWSAEVPGLGSHIAVNSGYDTYIISPDGKKIESAARGYWPGWSPDGRKIVFVRNDNELYIKPIFINTP